ncbi:MAG: M48 family metallopeptidase [Tissierellia bacterium]|nr:M48 family metallopeptidase [Tissierellia bacterium]
MTRKLSLSIVAFFVFLLFFIAILIISEYRNMEDLRVEYPDISGKVYDYRKSILKIWAINLLLKFLVPLLLLTTGLAKRIEILAGGNGRGLFLTGIICVVIFSIIDFLIYLPMSFYGGFVLGHRFGLSNQTIYRWLELELKSFALNTIVLALIVWFPYYLMKVSPNRWWLYLGLLAIPAIAFVTFISPTYIDPIFNKYTYLEDEELVKDIGKLLDKAGVGDAEIFQVDKSRDTKTMNAYMTGVFSSKRIVLWDTTINNLERDEVLAVSAHEIGHYVKGHIWKSIILGGLGSLFIMYLLYITSTWILSNSKGNFGFNNLHDLASLPLIILVMNFYMFFANPIMNFASRQMEREADAYEIYLTEDRKAAISAMLKLSEGNLSIPRPSRIYKMWYYTHPPVEERIEFFKNVNIPEDNP